MKISAPKILSIPFKTTLPAFVGLMLLAIQSGIQKISLSAFQTLEPGISHNQLISTSYVSAENEPNWLVNIGKVLFASYNNYFTFMLMMLLVNVIIHGSGILKHVLTKARNQKKSTLSQDSAAITSDQVKPIFISLLKSIIVYSLIYGIYQIMSIYMDGFFYGGVSLPVLSEVSLNPLKLHRILEEQSQLQLFEENRTPSFQKPSLSIGKVLSQMNFNARTIKLSKDEKKVFAFGSSPPSLKIIDVSDPEYPIILSSFPLDKNFQRLISKALALSPDETKLYISNFETLQIIDISNLKAPVLITTFQDEDLLETARWHRIPELCIPNLLVSKDNKFIFEAGYGLRIFDISNPTAPKVIHSEISSLSDSRLIPSSVFLSPDEKQLYYSNGSFSIYNVEDPKNIKLMNSLNTTFLITSMMLLQDAKAAFVMGSNQEGRILLQKLDISDIYSIEQGEIMSLNRSSKVYPVFMSQTPHDLFLLIGFQDKEGLSVFNALAVNTQDGSIVTHKKSLVHSEAYCVVFTEDYKKVFVGSVNKLEIVELYLDFPNKNAFSESNSSIQSLDVQMKFYKTALAPSNETILYSLSQGKRRFGIHKFSSGFENLTNISSLETGDLIEQMVISQDNKKTFWVSKNTISIVDISNPENITVLGEYAEEEKDKDLVDTLLLSRDGKTGFITHTYDGKNYLKIVDFSDPKNVIKKDSIEISKETGYIKPVLSKDERTVFVASRLLSIYNVSDHSSITFLCNQTALGDGYSQTQNPEQVLSPDGKTLFLKDTSRLRNLVIIIDVSNLTSPQNTNELGFSYGSSISRYEGNSFAFSADSRTLYFLQESGLAVVDISNVNAPRYLGAIQMEKDSLDDFTYFSLSGDSRKAYFFTQKAKFYVASIRPVYSTYLKEDILMLGERYSINLQALQMDKDLKYNTMAADYRFAKFAIVPSQSSKPEEVVLKMAPSWMNFDLNSRTLSVEARRKSDIGTYRVYFAFSTKLRESAFYEIQEFNSYLESYKLFAALVAQGYLDSEYYITQNFGKENNFILPVQYIGKRTVIYNTLKKYYFETYNEVNIVQSLNLTRTIDDTFKISTASMANLKVEINLESGGEAKFLTRYHGHLLPAITKGKTQLAMEGSVKDINYALEEVVVNLGLGPCDGEIIIDDKLNPIMTESIKNISKYFNHNLPPGLNKEFSLTLQDQIDHEVMYTGQYFQIKLNQKTFFDNYTEVENLSYQLVYVEENNETTILPTWLSFNDMTLMGTAPEAILDRDFEFKLIVKNEFQEYKEPLKISVRISSSFILKLLMKYSPYILSILGLLISANKIFNIMFKNYYKHPKVFEVRIGEEITDEVLFPISLIREEKQEAKTILKFLQKKKLLTGERELLDRLKMPETINTTLNELSEEEQKELDFYLGGPSERILLVNQIICNNLTMRMLNSQEEKKTRINYEKIKKKWVKFVDWDSTNACFKINDEKFKEILTSDGEETTISTSLIDKSNLNLDLLKDAILAYAFECQNLDILPVFIQFKVKEKIKANFLKIFLKLDLQDCPFSEKGKIGYGIRYGREFNTVSFSGTARRDIQGKTLVFQITDTRQRILREIWIFGKGNENRDLDSRGNEYQIL